MNLLEALVNAIRLPELRNKILFTGGILVIFRLFANVAVPGASQAALAQLFNSQALLGLLDCCCWGTFLFLLTLRLGGRLGCRFGRPRGVGCREWLRQLGRRAARADLARLAEDRDGTTALLDRLAGAGAEEMRLYRQLALQAASAEDLDFFTRVNEPGLDQGLYVDLRSVLESAQLGEVDD